MSGTPSELIGLIIGQPRLIIIRSVPRRDCSIRIKQILLDGFLRVPSKPCQAVSALTTINFFYAEVYYRPMSEEEKQKKSGGNMTIVVVLLVIAVCLLFGYLTKSWLLAIFVGVLAIGVFLILASATRSKQPDRYGTSESDSAYVFGFMITSIGVAGVVFALTMNFIFALMAWIIVVALYFAIKKYC